MTQAIGEVDAAGRLAALDLAQAMVRDLDGRITYWSGGLERLYGWPAGAAVGRYSHDLLATVFPRPQREIEAELLAGGQWHGELHHTARDGRAVRVISHWALQRDAAGRPTAVIEVNSDIGPQRRAEDALLRLAAIVGSSQDAVIGKTLDGIVTDWNHAAERLFGYAAGEIVGRPVVILFPPERVPEESAILERIRRGEKVETFETTRRHKDGRTIPVAVTISPILDSAGSIIGASKIVRDLSERVDRERRLGELQAELLHVSRLSELGQLVAALVHEVNQPLTAIGNYVSALTRLGVAGNEERVSLAVQKIAEQNERARSIVRRLHGFVRKASAVTRSEDLAGTIEDAIELARIGPAAQGVALSTRLVADPVQVEIDRVQIQQVLFNLMRNAMEAMETSSRRTLAVASRAAGKGMVEVSVADTGPGLPHEVLRNLFQPFVTTKPNGMGMGLSICRSIVEGHGGRLWVEENPGGGSVFRFTLRASPPDPGD